MQDEGRLSTLFMALEGGTHFLVVYSSKWCDKISFEHFYKQSDAIKFSSGLILLSKQDTKKPIRTWASFQMCFFSTAHIFPEFTLPLPSIKRPNSGMLIIPGVGHFSPASMQMKTWCAGHLLFQLLQFHSRFWNGTMAFALSARVCAGWAVPIPGQTRQAWPVSTAHLQAGDAGPDNHVTPARKDWEGQSCFPGVLC